MVSFLSKYWKKILIIITVIFIMINIVGKSIAPHKLVSEFAQYGPEAKMLSINIDTSGMVNSLKESVNIPDNVFSIGVVLVIGLIAAVIISELGNKKAPAKKK